MKRADNLKGSDRQQLQKRWSSQLYMEYERITYRYRLNLTPAVMVIGDFSSPLARWSSRTRSMEFSFDFIATHPWHIVLEVLKHEMAHQIVDELWGTSCVHGAFFKKAAQLLGMQPWAIAACVDIPTLAEASTQERSLSSQQERLLEKAQKLLALAASANQWEAELAMQKVHELYASYHLTLVQALEKPDYISRLLPSRHKRIATYQSLIAALLVKFFHVQVIHTSTFDALGCVEVKTLELCGVPHHVEMAEYVYHFLDERAKSLWRDYKQHAGAKKGLRPQAFYQGVISGFREKLQEQASRRSAAPPAASPAASTAPRPAAMALMLHQEASRLNAFVRYRHPRLATSRVGSGGQGAHLYAAGKEKGHQLVVHRPLAQGRSSTLGYLK